MTKAETDAEREIRNPGTGNRTAGGRQSEQLGLVVMAKPHYRTKLDEADAELVFDPWPKFERFIYILSPSPATRTGNYLVDVPNMKGAEMTDRSVPCSDPALEGLAERLFEKMNHLDPGEEDSWGEVAECDKHFYRACVEAILMEPELVRTALSEVGAPLPLER